MAARPLWPDERLLPPLEEGPIARRRGNNDEARLLALAAFDEKTRYEPLDPRLPLTSEQNPKRPLSIAGCDEVGRGALAGPAVVACVRLSVEPLVLPAPIRPHPLFFPLLGVDDSKRLSPRVREGLSERIATLARSGIGLATGEEIDRLGIVPALSLAARRAYHALGERVDLLLLDRGLTLGKDSCDLPPERSFTRGDASSLHIACASILAKVTRDRAMGLLDTRFPGYSFAKNKGYGTPSHIAALSRLGPSPVHRATFRIAERARKGTLIDSG